ncbi:glucose-6-phosphate dehydrogenase assembly protein OpcA [Kineococcus sp. TBRC 1896]|uniref:Glucose-6-phosphate dehydrogenase assembly protein OpcA n=1 Tax=Kineococcus mangrovi TaxID=1660183 RepID=A0ABV4I319_9ACTN
MIIDLPSTSTSAINKALIDLRDSGGAVALGRVLTLVVVTDDAHAEDAISAANEASREHPCRVLVLARGTKRGAARLDAQIRVGGDAGASEVIVLRAYGPLVEHGETTIVSLLLPDAPIVAYWPGAAPEDLRTDPIGRIAQRRITDSAESRDPAKALAARRATYREGDTDLAWTRLTNWRALLAAALDQPPYEPVTSITVAGAPDSPSTELLAAWLAAKLKAPVVRARTRRGTGVQSVRLERRSGAVELIRPDATVATLTQPGQPDRRLSLARRQVKDCLTEELRRLDPDEVYGEVLRDGLPQVSRKVMSARDAEHAGKLSGSRGAAARQAAAEAASAVVSEQMKGAPPEQERSDGTSPVAGEAPESQTPQVRSTQKRAAAATKTAAQKTTGQKTTAKKTTAKKTTAAKTAKKTARTTTRRAAVDR